MSLPTAWPLELLLPAKTHATLAVEIARQAELRRFMHALDVAAAKQEVWGWGRLARYERLRPKLRVKVVIR